MPDGEQTAQEAEQGDEGTQRSRHDAVKSYDLYNTERSWMRGSIEPTDSLPRGASSMSAVHSLASDLSKFTGTSALPDAVSSVAASSANATPRAVNADLEDRSAFDGVRKHGNDEKKKPARSHCFSRVQQCCNSIVASEDFELFIVVCILVNMVLLACYDVTDESNLLNQKLAHAELALTVIFSAELLLRIGAAGGSVPYFRATYWNAADAVLVLVGYFVLVSGVSTAARALRAVRALRPLRTLAHSESLKGVLMTLSVATPLLIRVALLIMVFLFVFAIPGIRLFRDGFHKKCVPSETTSSDSSPTAASTISCAKNGANDCLEGYECAHVGTGASTTAAGYDHIGFSFLTVLQCITQEDWESVMSLAAGGLNFAASVVFHLLMQIVIPFALINIFFGVLKVAWARADMDLQKQRQSTNSASQSAHLPSKQPTVRGIVPDSDAEEHMRPPAPEATDSHVALTSTKRSAAATDSLDAAHSTFTGAAGIGAASNELKPSVVKHTCAKVLQSVGEYVSCASDSVASSSLGRFLYRAVSDPKFDQFFATLVTLNMLTLLIDHYAMPTTMQRVLLYAEGIFSGLFVLECCIKVLAVGVRGYLTDVFNMIDGFVALLAAVELAAVVAEFENTAFLQPGSAPRRLLKGFRALRVFRLFRYFKSVRIIASVLLQRGASFGAIALLVMLFNTVYAILSMHLFSGIVAAPDGQVGFDNFAQSFVLMFLTLTVENWPQIMYNTVFRSKWPTVLVFISWLVLGKYVFLSLQTSVIIEVFETRYDEDDELESYFNQLHSTESFGRRVLTFIGISTRAFANFLLPCFSCCFRGSKGGTSVKPQQQIAPAAGKLVTSQVARSAFSASVRQQKSMIRPAPSLRRVLSRRAPPEEANESVKPGEYDNEANSGSPIQYANADPAEHTTQREVPLQLSSCVAPVANGRERTASSQHEETKSDGTNSEEQDCGRNHASQMLRHTPMKSSQMHRLSDTAEQVGQLADEFANGNAENETAGEPQNMHDDSMRRSGQSEALRKAPGMPCYGSANPGDVASDEYTRMLQSFQRKQQRWQSQQETQVPQIDEQAQGSGVSIPRSTGSADQGVSVSKSAASLGGSDGKEDNPQDHNGSEHTYSRSTANSVQGSQSPAQPTTGAHAYGALNDLPKTGWALCIIPPGSKLRSYALVLVSHWIFEAFYSTLILASCVAMLIEEPQMENPKAYRLQVINLVLVVFFVVEVVLKSIPGGFTVYFGSNTNKLDFLIVVGSITSLAAESIVGNDVRAIRSLRALRALRPLRAFSRSAGLRTVLHALQQSLSSMSSVALILLLSFFTFGVIGTQLYKGQFFSCNDTSVSSKGECVGQFETESGELLERKWQRPYLHFDNVGRAMYTLFYTLTLDSYLQALYSAMAISGENMQPQANNSEWNMLFFFIFIMVNSFVLINTFLGVIFLQFTRLRMLSRSQTKSLTWNQRQWKVLAKHLLQSYPDPKPPQPKSTMRRVCWYITYSTTFSVTILICIVLNIMLMATVHEGEGDEFANARYIVQSFFNAVFVFEAAIKWIGLGTQHYLKRFFDKLEFALAVLALAELLSTPARGLSADSGTSGAAVLSLLRLFTLLRVFRLLRLAYAHKGMRSLMETMVNSFPAMGSIAAVYLIVIFIFAYTGMLAFGSIARTPDGLTQSFNFETVPNAMLTLFSMGTATNWIEIVKGASISEEETSRCSNDERVIEQNDLVNGRCGRPRAATAFFVCFMLVTHIVLINLWSAVIVENFEEQHKGERFSVTPSDIDSFVELWSAMCTPGRASMPVSNFVKLLELMPVRMQRAIGLQSMRSRVEIVRLLNRLNIQLDSQGEVPFHGALFHLIREPFEVELPDGEITDELVDMVRRKVLGMKKVRGQWKSNTKSSLSNFRVGSLLAAILVQKRWRAKVAKRRAERSRSNSLSTARQGFFSSRSTERARASLRRSLERVRSNFTNGMRTLTASKRTSATKASMEKQRASYEDGVFGSDITAAGKEYDASVDAERNDASIASGIVQRSGGKKQPTNAEVPRESLTVSSSLFSNASPSAPAQEKATSHPSERRHKVFVDLEDNRVADE